MGTIDGVGVQHRPPDVPAAPNVYVTGLTPLEQKMVAYAAAGKKLDCGKGPADLAKMKTWGKGRTVNAAVLRQLLVAEQWPVHAKGIRLRGLRIRGLLDLEGATLRCPLSLDNCYLDAHEPPCLDHATALHVSVTGCHLPGLKGEMLTATELNFSGSTLTRELCLLGANIVGRLICSSARLKGRDSDGNALVAFNIKVGSDVFLNEGFTAAGAVQLAGADIAGTLDCSGARLKGRDSDGNALVAFNMKAGRYVFFRKVVTTRGAVQLTAADITADLSCSGAQLAANNDGNALVAERLKAGGAVHLHREFTAAGALQLSVANITGELSCSGAQLAANNDGNALVAVELKVGSDVLLNEGFTAAGTVSLESARVGGLVVLGPGGQASGGEVAFAFSAARAQIAGALRWVPIGQVSGPVNLEGVTVGELEDDWSGKGGSNRENGFWPVGGRLRLDGFTYGRFAGDHHATIEQRLAWIRSQYKPKAKPTVLWTETLAAPVTISTLENTEDFTAQPYEQLVATYRQAGQDTEARRAAIARRADLRKYGKLNPYRRLGNWLLDKTIKYGYQTWRAAVALAVVFVAFLALSILGQHQHMIVPIGDTKGLHPVPSATQCTSNYPCFYPAGYTIDTVIPLINVHQADYWGPDGHAPLGWVWIGGTWVAIALGWALATLLVAGYTGLVRQQ